MAEEDVSVAVLDGCVDAIVAEPHVSDDVVSAVQYVTTLENLLLTVPQVKCQVEHLFCAGMYARVTDIPAGTLVTGGTHRHECFLIILDGLISVTAEDGSEQIATIGDVLRTEAGQKRAGLAMRDSRVMTVHRNDADERDTDRLWDMVFF